jgi:hypothetical protein
MSGWIEIVIGRLLVDDEFRAGFLRDPHRALEGLLASDTRSTHTDTASLAELVNAFHQVPTPSRLETADTQSNSPLAE